MRPTALSVASPLFYTEWGGGDPVVLLHGLGADHRIWEQVAPALARNWRVFTPDLPGHGRSSLPDREIDPGLFARSVARWLDGLGIAPVHIVGHSLGAAVAVSLALERSDLVRSLLLINPVLLTEKPPADGVLRAFRRFGFTSLLGKPSQNEVRRFLEHGLGVPAATLTQESMGYWQESTHRSRQTLSTFARELRQPQFGLPLRMHRVQCPVAMLWGEHDLLFPGADAAVEAAKRFPNAQNEFAEVAHLPMVERPSELAAWLGHRLQG